jgi:hypothetical protein
MMSNVNLPSITFIFHPDGMHKLVKDGRWIHSQQSVRFLLRLGESSDVLLRLRCEDNYQPSMLVSMYHVGASIPPLGASPDSITASNNNVFTNIVSGVMTVATVPQGNYIITCNVYAPLEAPFKLIVFSSTANASLSAI